MSYSLEFISDIERPAVREISVDESSQWLHRGLQDFFRRPAFSLTYGSLFTVLAFLQILGLQAMGLASLILPVAAGFMLVAPMFAVLFYEISRRHEQGLEPSIRQSIANCLSKAQQLSWIGVMLMLVLLSWMLLALVIFAVFYGVHPPPMNDFIVEVLSAPQAVPFLIVGTVVGGACATAAFALSAVSLPMVLDRDVSAVTAMATSLDAVLVNWKVMIGWGLMISFITGVGMCFLFVGLAFTMPLIGYASWHAYRALVV